MAFKCRKVSAELKLMVPAELKLKILAELKADLLASQCKKVLV